jgi:hypothetical protein
MLPTTRRSLLDYQMLTVRCTGQGRAYGGQCGLMPREKVQPYALEVCWRSDEPGQSPDSAAHAHAFVEASVYITIVSVALPA